MAAQDLSCRAVHNQFTKTVCPAIDDCASSGVKVDSRGHYILRFARLRFGEAHLRIFRVGETANRRNLIQELHRRSSDRVGAGHEAVLNCLRNEHEPTGDVAGGEDVGCRGLKKIVDANKASGVSLDVCLSEIQSGRICHPADCRHSKGCFNTISMAIIQKKHPHTSRSLLKRFDNAEVFSDHDTRFAKGGGDSGRHFFVLGRQDARSGMKELDS